MNRDSTVLAFIRMQTRPGIVRARRKARAKAILRRAWALRRFVLVPVAFVCIWLGFFKTWGVNGLIAAVIGTTIGTMVFYLLEGDHE